MLEPAYLSVVLIGLLHGLEPGHGWPVALVYSTRRHRPLLYGLVSSGIISLFHFISSITVVVLYVLLSYLIDLSTPLMKYIAAAMLVVLALRFLMERVEDYFETQHDHFHENLRPIEHEHEHEHMGQGVHIHPHKHAKRVMLSLWGIAAFAFVLGFAHEEEFALLAFVVGGINPLLLMIFYAISVTVALIGVTILCIGAYRNLKWKIRRLERYLPKVNALVLMAMAAAFVLNLA